MLRLLLILLVGCAGPAMQTVRFVNRTDHTIEAVYVYPTGTANRGASRAKLSPNAETQLKIAAGNIDVYAVMEKIKVDTYRSDTRTASGTIELRAPAVVIFHESDVRPAELAQPNVFGVTFGKPAGPAKPESGEPEPTQPEPP